MSLRDDREVRWQRELLEREPAIRQLVGDARCLSDQLGRPVTVTDVLAALADTGLYLVHDADGYGPDACRWAALLIVADPLDLDTATDGIDSHWDREQQGRDEAAQRSRLRIEKGPPDG